MRALALKSPETVKLVALALDSVGGDARNFGENAIDGGDACAAAEVKVGDFERGNVAVRSTRWRRPL